MLTRTEVVPLISCGQHGAWAMQTRTPRNDLYEVKDDYSPEQISGYLRKKRECCISDETIKQTNCRLRKLAERHPEKFHTITADNGCEFHGYEQVEQTHGFKFYFAPPHHSWERGSNENANGLIRQYLAKGKCLNDLTQDQCDRIANKMNHRCGRCRAI
jgi:IS30 family transposase